MLRPPSADGGDDFTVSRTDDGGWRVRGTKPERWVRQTDFSNDEAVGFLADRLDRLGVEAELLKRGAHEGDTVLIGRDDNSVVFDFKPSVAAGAEMLGRRGEDQRFDEKRPARQRRREIDEAMEGREEGETRADVARRVREQEPDPSRPARRRTRSGPSRTRTPTGPRPAMRTEVDSAKRIVVKVGSSSLTTAEGGIDPSRVRLLAEVLAGTRARGIEVVLVSSGAIAAGLAPLRMKRRPKSLPAQQAAASVGQGLLVHRYTEELARHGVITGQVLLTLDDMTRRSHYRNAYQTFAKLLELGVLPIVNENDTVATTEIRFGDNDRLAALVAHLVHADLLVLLSDVDGLYDAAPDVEGSALVTDVRGPEDLEHVRLGRAGNGGVGTGGMQTKLEAARIATGAGIPAVLTAAEHAGAALAGEPVGTLFPRHREAAPDPPAVAGARDRAAGHAPPRRRRGPRGHPAPRLTARRGPHRGGGQLRRRRPRRHRRCRRRRRGPGPGQLRLDRAARAARPHRRARGRPPRRAGTSMPNGSSSGSSPGGWRCRPCRSRSTGWWTPRPDRPCA